MRKIHILLILITLVLTACDNVMVPIDPDDFGYPKVAVSASGKNITGTQDNELSEWIDSGYQYNGDMVAIMVYNDPGDYTSLWSSWFGSNENTVSSAMQSASMCSIATPKLGDTSVTFTDPSQPPCIFSQGQGLYMLLTNPSISIKDPNLYQSVNRNPSGPLTKFFTLGLWQSVAMYSQGSLAGGYLGNLNNSTNYITGHAFFKILDKYYDDNSGGFLVSLKRGFTSNETPPITYVINMVTTKMNNTAQYIFQTIIKNSDYLLALKAALTIYMMICGILYISGLLNMTQKELFYTFMRLIIVTQLLTSTTSWQFFNDYLFTLFTSGLMCQHFSGQLVTQIFVFFRTPHIPLVINNH